MLTEHPVRDRSTSLTLMTRASEMLAQATTIQKAKELKNLALTAQEWAQRKGAGEEAIQHCRTYALLAERRLGELLAATERAKGTDKAGRKSKLDGSRRRPSNTPPTLADLGVSKDESAKAQKLADLPEPEFQEVLDGKSAKTAIRRRKREKAAEAVRRLPAPTEIAGGPWGVIVADPPWRYDCRAEDGTHRAALPYPSMGLDEIRGLALPPLADDAILWLWTTNAHMEHAFGVARAWGFEPRTILTWVKDKMGTGDWLRGQTEHCLLCGKGRPVLTLTNQTTVLRGPMRAHSEKPDEFFAMVEALCPDTRRIEMFARKARAGWACWGDTGK